MASDYEKRLLRVLDHVYANLDGDLSLDTLADVAALSRFHFHRVFTAVTGETLAGFIRRVRLHRAANLLLAGDRPLAEIAATCGYPNPRSFSRVFGEAFGRSPSAFRAAGVPLPPLTFSEQGPFTMYDVSIQDQPARRLAVIHHHGDFMKIAEAFDKAGATVMARGMAPHLGAMIGVYFNEPANTPEPDLRSAAGFEVIDDSPIEAPLDELILSGGSHAILTYKGPYAGLRGAYEYLFGEWLGKSGRLPREEPPFELYVNSPMDTAPEDLITLIGVPLHEQT